MDAARRRGTAEEGGMSPWGKAFLSAINLYADGSLRDYKYAQSYAIWYASSFPESRVIAHLFRILEMSR